MIGLDELLRRFAGLERGELVGWIEKSWVLPEYSPDAIGERVVFREVDIARVELILQFRREFAVDDEAMEVVLGLLDQVYALRRQLYLLCDAVAVQPPEIQAAIGRALPKASGG